jgi:hypothetical protein
MPQGLCSGIEEMVPPVTESGCGQRLRPLCFDESKRAIKLVKVFFFAHVPAGELNEH